MPSRAAWVEIDLGAIAHNYQEIRSHIQPGAKLCAIVKADAYGHGAIAVARKAIAAGADYLAVATISEAQKLREAGFTTPLLILGLTKPDSSFDIVDADLTQTVCRLDLVQALSAEAVAQGKRVKVHLAVDTGLGRIGVRPEDAAHFARIITAMPGIELEGIFSHFALADIADKTFSMEQIRLFQEACESVKAAGIDIPIRHIAESAAILDLPNVHFDMVRAGIVQYGLWPSDEVTRPLDLRPAMKFCARIVYIKTIPPGTSIGYGRHFIAKRESRIATISVGYADGYIRAYGGGCVEVRGKRAPIAGRICMDQCMIDVTDIPEAKLGDVVTLFGSETLTADDLAHCANTISYEVLCLVSKHVSRIYMA
jgi:alanine racemase